MFNISVTADIGNQLVIVLLAVESKHFACGQYVVESQKPEEIKSLFSKLFTFSGKSLSGCFIKKNGFPFTKILAGPDESGLSKFIRQLVEVDEGSVLTPVKF